MRLTNVTNRSRASKPMTDTEIPEHEPEQIRLNSLDTTVFPYRGIETHGVDPDQKPTVDPDSENYGTTVAVPIEPEPERDPPIAIYVVADPDGGPDPLDDWRNIAEYVRPNECRMILGLDEFRSNTVIRNTHATDTLYVSPGPFVDVNLAYPILPLTAHTFSRATTPVYARAGAANAITVAIIFDVMVKR